MQVGYLGVGNMGQPMAGKLMDAGHSLVVFDISEAAMEPLLLRQARRAVSPRDLGINAKSSRSRCRRSPPFERRYWGRKVLRPGALSRCC